MTLTPEQIQAQVSAILKKSGAAGQVVALRHRGTWTGPASLPIGDETHQIAQCVSDLQAREILGQWETQKQPGVLLCDFPPGSLGDDVLARLAKRRVHQPQTTEMLMELFGAQKIDSRALACKALVEALVKDAGAKGYPPVTSGILDLDFAWRAFLNQRLRRFVGEITLQELLGWTHDPEIRAILLGMNEGLRSELAHWLTQMCGTGAKHIFEALSSELGGQLVALGLLEGLIGTATAQGVAEATAAAARLEQFYGDEQMDAIVRGNWSDASASMTRNLLQNEIFKANEVIQQLDALISKVRLDVCARFSDFSRKGLDQRIETAGARLKEAVADGDDQRFSEAQDALKALESHALVDSEELRIERLKMGLRLRSWLLRDSLDSENATLSDLVHHYFEEGGYVEWARSVASDSDPNPVVKDALRLILEKTDGLWRKFETAFVERLQAWSAQDSELHDVLRIENVLHSVAGPVASQVPALLVVLDGMSVAVFRELLKDLLRRDWVETSFKDQPRAALAAIPSVTEISRRALLCGALPFPSSGVEKTHFGKNEKLFQQTGGSTRPQLFLKGDLVEPGAYGLSSKVAQAIGNTRCRLIGVVVNAIDDTLGSADQTAYNWGLDQITPLYELMRLAAEMGRVVILTSDHGHVLDGGSSKLQQPTNETADRYRLPGGDLSDGEMEFKGPRIQAATGSQSIVALAAQRLRYTNTKRRGYHGGVCPAEMVVPCVILRSAHTNLPDEGWTDLPPYEPSWWSIQGTVVMAEKPQMAPVGIKIKKPTPEAQQDLFETLPDSEPTPVDWIDSLLASEIYESQAQLAVRGAPDRDQIRNFLNLLEQRNGNALRPHVAQQMNLPLFRVDGLIQNYRRLLNIDGSDVLSYDPSSETVVLNVNLLKSQFEL
jgi:hypothetical protein